MNIVIRQEEPEDYPEVEKLLNSSFDDTTESVLVSKLRKNTDFIPELSLVAVHEDAIVGYILFFPITIAKDRVYFPSLALAPMAVSPDHRGKGIGGKLMRTGLQKSAAKGFSSVIVLGHPDYYPKFGFEPASKWNIKAPFDVPDNAFLAIELRDEGLINVSGTVQYPKEFSE